LNGAELAEAELWLKDPDAPELGYSDALFGLVQASIVVNQTRRNQRSRSLLVVSTILLAILIILTILTVVQRRRIQKLEQLLRQQNMQTSRKNIKDMPGTTQ
jgi:membrane associated rhomboid family serine protease